MAPLLFGLAATTAGVGGATVTAAATTGLIGTAGSFALAPALLTAGIATTALGTIQAGRAAQAQGELEQEILNQNAKLKEREGEAELRRSRAEAERFRKEGEALQGTQQVGLAKGGVLTSEGTPALLLETTAQELEADRMLILKEGFLAQSFRESEAENLRFQGRAAKATGKNRARGTILSSIGQTATSAAAFV